jgi:hypothetical protein
MSVVVSVHQPNFMPWTKLLAKIVASDVFVAYDSVQFNKREFHARQRFATARGGPAFLSVPVRHTGKREVIHEMRIVTEQPWRARHLDFLVANYGHTPYFGEVFPVIEGVYAADHELLAEHNIALIEAFCGYLGSPVRVVRASSLPHAGSREERLLDLVRAVGWDEHLTSTTSTHEIDWSGFRGAGIPVWTQEFTAPVYEQPIPDLAAADLLFWRGRSGIRSLTRQ